MDANQCRGCGSFNFKTAQLMSAALQLTEGGALSRALGTGASEVKATVCLDCGLIGELRADPAVLKKGEKS
jgi:hypothetical protein